MAGTHTREDRFDNLSPMVVEFFHVLQDFLQKLCKKFLKVGKSIEQGTLANLQLVIHRSNVNGQVKVRFKAHEDFVLTVGKAYLIEMIMEHFQMDNKDSVPAAHQFPTNVSRFAEPRRRKVFDSIMDEFVDKYLTPFELEEIPPEITDILLVRIGTTEFDAKAVVDSTSASVKFAVAVGDQMPVQVNIPIHLLEHGKEVSVKLPGLQQPAVIKCKKEEPDDLNNYTFNFQQWYFVMKYFKDAIKQGDTVRANISLKLMIPHFYLHSKLSKYLVECMDYILKTEVLLSPQMSLRVQAGSFINRKGKAGKNKPADMEKENQVKFLKDLIRGLGKGKTEKAIVQISQAGPVFQDIVANFDTMASIQSVSSRHKPKSSVEDLDTLFHHLRNIRPFRKTPGRRLKSFNNIPLNPFKNIDRKDFERIVMKTCERLKRNEYLDIEEEDDIEQ